MLKSELMAPAVYGSVKTADLAWGLWDIGVRLMAWLNIIIILLLCKTAFTCLKNYETQLARGEDPVFYQEKLGIKRADYWVGDRAELKQMRESTGHP